MRTIKFRAKSVEGHNIGEWVFGDLHIRSAFSHIHTDVGTRCKIDPNTIGEFTGLLNKNGTEIYEGDIVTFDNHLQGISQVVYDYAGFEVISKNYRTALRPMMNNYIRVIGNIHDNPELLKR